jgi:dTMP kinase
MEKRGKLIIVEGTDCSGKATQTQKLIERVEGLEIPCTHLTFPRYDTVTGKIVGMCYLGKDLGQANPRSWFWSPTEVDPKIASAFYAVDRYAASFGMRMALEKGKNIICDRYVESNMGHQGGKIKDPDERKKFIRWLEKLEYELYELPRPDGVIFLYMPYQVGMELKKGRAGMADAHEANPEHLRNAEEAYLQLAEMYDWIKIDCAPDKTRGSLRSVEDIGEEVFEKAMKILK